MVEPADHRDGTDAAEVSSFELAMFGSVLREREMCSRPVVIVEVLGEYATQMTLAEDDHVIEALPTDGSDHSFNERILPGGSRRSPDLLDAQRVNTASKLATVYAVAIAK